MTRVALTGGAYQARSIIANAQRCINLYPEKNPDEDSPPTPVTHYQTPGLNLLTTGPVANAGMRCSYRASNGNLYVVINTNVYSVSNTWVYTLIGTIAAGSNIVSIGDNGFDAIVVDGTPSGYTIDLSNNAFAPITDPGFYGADRVDVLDGFFILNRPGTNEFYVSGELSTSFDPLDIASKNGYPDNIVTLIVMHREIWLIGALTTEVWYNSGNALFTFQAMPGVFIEHGCVAKYSLAKQDLSVYWLSQDQQGQNIVLLGNNYAVKRISTHAIENEFLTYPKVSDAIGFIYQQEGHVFYVLTFPTANKTWAYDETTEQWHQWAYTDNDGNLNRHRANCCANAYGVNVVGDWQNGNLYQLDLNTYNDNGQPISRIRSFPHLIDDGNRIAYRQAIADVAVGADSASIVANPPLIYLRWSDDRGQSYSNFVGQSLGAGGEYLTSVQWNRLGLARDRVFELSWSGDFKTALQGAFIDVTPAGT